MNLGFGFSPCPNDTFAFDALVHGRIDGARSPSTPALHDIEQLNALAREGRYELTKLSFGALAGLRDRYTMLRSGGALGRGCGPLVVAREAATLAQAVCGPVRDPGLGHDRLPAAAAGRARARRGRRGALRRDPRRPSPRARSTPA